MTRTNANNQRLPVNLNPDFLIRFPPFPTVPPGVTIIPFKDWKQRGIRVDPWPAGSEGIDSETETDTLGIPTVPMKKRHPTDEPKSHQRKKRLRKSNQIPDAPGPEGDKRRGWMNSRWESGELARLCTVDPRDTQIARLYAAAGHFKSGRTWPAPQRLVGLVDLWELVCFFLLPSSYPSQSTFHGTRS
ncbi:hypothetical protein BDQ17DRAFT_684326 [Cyathus striatus]|nr:hypothetical protein BDQ17DRAFT_684326 [Cyathus striatus]